MGAVGGFEVEESRLRAKVPDDFELWDGAYKPGFRTIYWWALSCPRLVFNETVIPDHAEFVITADVVAKNSSWEPVPAASRYILEWYVKDKNISDGYNALGIPAQAAAFTTTPAIGAQGRLTTWTISRDATSFEFSIPSTNQPLSPRNTTNYLWIGRDVYMRLDAAITWSTDGEVSTGLMEFEGPSSSRDVVNAPVGHWVGRTIANKTMSTVVSTDLFFGGD